MIEWEGMTFIEINLEEALQHLAEGYYVKCSRFGMDYIGQFLTEFDIREAMRQYDDLQLFKLHNWGSYK
jgi:hypothetical protein